MKKKAIVAGHICLDITPVFKTDSVQSIESILQPGKLVEMGNAQVSTGGAVANTGLAMKKLGADVSLMGKVGKDAFGDMILNILDKYDAKDGMIRLDGESSSYSIVLALPGIDRMFLHCPGANNTYTSDDINEKDLNDACLFHFGYPPIMKSMYINDGEELIKLLKKVKDSGCAISLDLAAVDPNSEAGKADWKLILSKVLPLVDFFVPSIEELCFMLDRDLYNNWQERAKGKDITEILDLDKDIRPLGNKCMELGVKVLLLKCGKPGLYYRSANKEELSSITNKLELNVDAWAQKEGFEKSFKPNKVLSATGAGDTSIAAFLTAMLNGESIEKSVELASATGACCVETYDALSGLCDLDSIKNRIKKGWGKNN